MIKIILLTAGIYFIIWCLEDICKFVDEDIREVHEYYKELNNDNNVKNI